MSGWNRRWLGYGRAALLGTAFGIAGEFGWRLILAAMCVLGCLWITDALANAPHEPLSAPLSDGGAVPGVVGPESDGEGVHE